MHKNKLFVVINICVFVGWIEAFALEEELGNRLRGGEWQIPRPGYPDRTPYDYNGFGMGTGELPPNIGPNYPYYPFGPSQQRPSGRFPSPFYGGVNQPHQKEPAMLQPVILDKNGYLVPIKGQGASDLQSCSCKTNPNDAPPIVKP